MINLFSELDQLTDDVGNLQRLLQIETDAEDKQDLRLRLRERIERQSAVTCLINQGRLSASEEEIQAAK